MFTEGIIITIITGIVGILSAVIPAHKTHSSNVIRIENRLDAAESTLSNVQNEIKQIKNDTKDINVLKTMIDNLEVAQTKHNAIIERTYKLEQHDAVQDEKINRLEERVHNI